MFEQIDGVFFRLSDRWGPVICDSNDAYSLGAETASNNTAELSAFGEVLLFAAFELDDWTTRGPGLVFCYDSTYSIGAGTGAYRPQENLTFINTIKSIWSIFNVDAFPVFGLKVKFHLNQPQNEYADGLADLGAQGYLAPMRA